MKQKKGMTVIKKLYNILPRNTFLAICKSFVQPHVGYGDIGYVQPIKAFWTLLKWVSMKQPLWSQTQSSKELLEETL